MSNSNLAAPSPLRATACRTRRAPAIVAGLVALVAAAGAGAQSTPALTFSNASSGLLFGRPYDLALHNLLGINEVAADAAHLQSGLLTGSPAQMIRAGAGYNDAWTRDASVNTWNAASLVAPGLASNTLWAVVDKQANGQLIVRQDIEWWDQVIWITSAWNHYMTTGDRAFLANAYQAAVNTLNVRKSANYDSQFELFQGASFFNDGIAGYPSPPADDGETHGGFVLDYPGAPQDLCLSTNAIYYEAYESVAKMGKTLGASAAELAPFKAMAKSLKKAINRQFWIPAKGTYGYLLHNNDGAATALDTHQEGSGLAFAILFGIAGPDKAAAIIKSTTVSDWGITDVSPNFPRYSDQRPGRHNQIVWPMVQGYWADAAAHAGSEDLFGKEVARLAKLAINNGGFWEIYNARNGTVDGGWQTGGHWQSQPDQTWSASAYLRMIYDGVFGMHLKPDSLAFEPTLPAGWGDVSLGGIAYRGAVLKINLHGAGHKISSFLLDGKKAAQHSVPSSLTGAHTIDITLGGAIAGDRDGDGVADALDACPDEAGSAALSGCPDPVHLEAEDAYNSGGPLVSVEHSGYTGRGYVEGPRVPGALLNFSIHRASPQAGNFKLSIRYSNGNSDSRTLSLYAGNRKITQLSFAPTTNWDTWGVLTTPIALASDDSQLTLRWDEGDDGHMNLDSIGLDTAQ